MRYLLDENLRGTLWRAIQQHNRLGIEPLDVARVGDPSDLVCGSTDAAVLAWAEYEGRILVSRDVKTLPHELASHLSTGRHCPGIFLLRRHASVRSVVEFLVAAAYESEALDWQDHVEYIP